MLSNPCTNRRPHRPSPPRSPAVLALALAATFALVSLAPAAQAGTIVYGTTGCGWSPPIKESAGVDFKCAGGTVMTGVQHQKDENGDSQYECCSLTPQPVNKTACAWSAEIKESNSNYTCPSGQAMVGRWHNKDENGPTKYYCCNLNNDVGQILPDDATCYWSASQRQSASKLECKAGEVMRGRAHQGDENGDTEIYCCKFKGDS